jgi:hypothetical protein
MALVDLKTDLKSLKYGLDRRGMGSSKEPFITKPIPEEETPGATLDVLLRQGSITAAQDDASRLTKLLLNNDPRGNKFILNTNLLSRSSVKTEATKGSAYGAGIINQGVYTPTSTIAQVLVNAGGEHLNLLGINPLSPLTGVPEGGLFSIGGLNRYERIVRELNDEENSKSNRLVSLLDTKILGSTIPSNPLVSSNPLEILSYGGGPGSILGVGKTKIKRASETKTEKTAYTNSDGSPIIYTTVNRQYTANPNFVKSRYGNLASPSIAGSTQYTFAEDKFNANNTNLLNTSVKNEAPDSQLFKFYLQFLSPPSDDTEGIGTETTYLYWQAYVDNFTDNIGAEYDSYNYVGLGYPLYKYSGFKRSISLDFTIVADSPSQLLPIYTKLNKLIQFMAPNYSNAGYMRGNFVKLTFGDYLNSTPGIINGFTLNPIFEAGFDIGGTEEEITNNITSGKQLPKAIKISGFNFTPIADNGNRVINKNSSFISAVSV